MNKILFLMAYPLENKKVSLVKKFDGQIRAAENIGIDTWYTAYKKNRLYLCGSGENRYLGKSINATQNFLQSYFLFKRIKKIVGDQNFDLCYIRYVPPTPAFIKALKVLRSSGCKVVVEVPTFIKDTDKNENFNRFPHNLLIPLLRVFYARKAAKYIDLFTLIGDQTETFLGVDALNIENGLDTLSFPLVAKNKYVNNEIRLIAVAHMSYWHGYDRVIEGLKLYYSEPRPIKVYFHLVGHSSDGSIARWKIKVKEYGIEEFVIFEGYKTGLELDEIFNKSDIAIGCLGLYRKNLDISSQLKVIEYCARGVPFIYAGSNKLLDEDKPFFIKVLNDSSAIDINQLLITFNNLKTIPELPSKIRDYAINNMGWENQLQKIINYVSQL